MTDGLILEHQVATHYLSRFPEIVRNSLATSSQFRDRYAIETNAHIEFGASGISVRRNHYFRPSGHYWKSPTDCFT